MTIILSVLFSLAYAAIAFEHALKANKAAIAIVGAGVLWAIYALSMPDVRILTEEISETVSSTAQIIFFLIGAMTIVEVIDAHRGFSVVTDRIKTRSLPALLLIICTITFFLSATLDNLTTAIVMVSLLKKLIGERSDRAFFAGLIVIAANAGGAWSPIGDVTTTMLWIGGQITSYGIIKALFFPSIVSLAIPLFIAMKILNGRIASAPTRDDTEASFVTSRKERNIVFFLGITILIAVPIFKTITHLPPFIGILLGLGILWIVGDILHKGKEDEVKAQLDLSAALSRIDMSSVIFFIGILFMVSTLEHSHILSSLAHWLNDTVGREDSIVLLIGLASAVVDNVPLVAASIGMYDLQIHPADSFLWEFLAYCCGTGGSILVIGSAAGVAAMGIEKINFVWYLKNISFLAFVGYICGAMTYLILQ